MADTLVPARSPDPAQRSRRRPAVTSAPTSSIPRSQVLVAGAAAIVGVIASHLAFGLWMRVPIIHPDELGYLQNARFLASGGLRSQTEYYPGFSLLLVPVALATSSPTALFRAAIVANGALAAVFAVLVWNLAPTLMPILRGWRRAAVVALVCAYPPFVLYSNFALSETAFATMFVAVVMLATKAFSGGRAAWWLALGAAASVLALVHPRGFAVVVAVALMGTLVALTGEADRLRRLGALVVGTGAGLALTRWLVTFTKGANTGFGAYRPDSVLSKSLSLHGLASLASELGGQFWYLSLATLGLVPLGLLVAGRGLVKVLRGDRRPWVVAQAFTALSFVGVWALSSLFMNLGERTDKLIYGRYNEGAIAPLLVVALVELLGPRVASRHNAVRKWVFAFVVATAGGGAFVRFGHSAAALRGVLNPANVLGLEPLFRRMDGHIHVIAMSAITCGLLAVVAAVCWRFPAAAAVLLGAGCLWVAIDVETGYLVPGSRARAAQADIAGAITAIRALPGVDLSCVAWDQSQALDFGYYNTRFRLPEQQFQQLDSTDPAQTPCGTLVVSDRDAVFAAAHPSARVVTSEDFVDDTLWALPRPDDPTFGILDAAGFLSPPGPNAATPLTLADRSGAVVTSPATAGVRVPAGGSTDVVLTIHHPAGGAPWPASAALRNGGAYAIRLMIRWPASANAPVSIAELPDTLLPGGTALATVHLSARAADGAALAPGPYVVSIGLYQEAKGLFADPPIIVPVTVTG